MFSSLPFPNLLRCKEQRKAPFTSNHRNVDDGSLRRNLQYIQHVILNSQSNSNVKSNFNIKSVILHECVYFILFMFALDFLSSSITWLTCILQKSDFIMWCSKYIQAFKKIQTKSLTLIFCGIQIAQKLTALPP